jgi:hypothetical protein
MVIATRSTAIGAFASRAEAEQAISGLLGAGFASDQVGIVLPDAEAPGGASVDAEPITVCVGGMFRSLIGVEIPDAEVRYYEDDLQEGRPLVIVHAADRYQEAIDILYRIGGKYMAPF